MIGRSWEEVKSFYTGLGLGTIPFEQCDHDLVGYSKKLDAEICFFCGTPVVDLPVCLHELMTDGECDDCGYGE